MAKARGISLGMDGRGKCVLGAAITDAGYGSQTFANKLLEAGTKCTHTAIRNLVRLTEGATWASHLVRPACKALGLPEFEVIAGLSEDEREMLRCLDNVRRKKPERVSGFVKETVTRARDISGEELKRPRVPSTPPRLPARGKRR